MITSNWKFYYTTTEQPNTEIEVEQKICKRPEHTKVWNDLQTKKLPNAIIKTVGYKRVDTSIGK